MYVKWEGTRHGEFCEGVIETSDGLSHDVLNDSLVSRLRARGIYLAGGYVISRERACEIWESERRKTESDRLQKRVRRLSTVRTACGAVGIIGCTAASLLLPVPVAIWAASAFAALTATAAVPP